MPDPHLTLLLRVSALETGLHKLREELMERGCLERPAPVPQAPALPVIEATVINEPFRPMPNIPYAVVAKFSCPACDQVFENSEFRVMSNPAVAVTQCQCGQQMKIKLAWTFQRR